MRRCAVTSLTWSYRLLAPNVDRLHDWFHEAFERTNFKGFWLSTPLRPPVIFLVRSRCLRLWCARGLHLAFIDCARTQACRPDVMEHVLKTNFDNYIKPPDAADRLREVPLNARSCQVLAMPTGDGVRVRC